MELYKRESDARVKERLLLVVILVDDKEMPAHVAKGLHRSKTWASYWLHRYSKEGIKGLQDKPKNGRVPQIPLEVSARIRKTLMESRQGWTIKQVNELIVKESGIRHHYTHVYRLLHKWGFKQKVPRRYM